MTPKQDPGAKSHLGVWVIVSPQGLVYVGLHKDEDETWSIALGWPDTAEIAHHKALGWYAAEATLTWKDPRPPAVDPRQGKLPL